MTKSVTRKSSCDHVPQGTYLLLVHLDHKAELRVGRLGTFRFDPGWYAYCGSALGPGGLPARLARHSRADKRLHWHIDYLLQHAALETVWQTIYPRRLECAWAATIRDLPDAQTPVRGFGASDCRCTSHLIYLPRCPDDREIKSALARRSPAQADICCRPSTCP
jgi:Uri superfamily endonuclease